MRTQHARGWGIFQCDEAAIFNPDANFTIIDGLRQGTRGRRVAAGPLRAVAFNPANVGVSQDGTAANTQLFINIWDAVRRDGRYNWFDFTVKVDPDAVLLPGRLRAHLRPHLNRVGGFYVKNCNKYPSSPNFPMMYGSVEVFSKVALQVYFSGATRCQQILAWGSWGEDFFMTKCLDMLGLSAVLDVNLVGDKRCIFTTCSDGKWAAYHDFKSVKSWKECWTAAESR